MLWLLQHRCGNVGTPLHRKLAIAKAKCARLVLHLFEKKFPDDARPRQAIEAAEAYGESAAAYAAAYAAAAAAASSARLAMRRKTAEIVRGLIALDEVKVAMGSGRDTVLRR